MTDRHDIDDDELMAYVDGELSARRRRAIERLMARDPLVARKVDALRDQVAHLRRAFGPVLDEPVPARLLHSARPRDVAWARVAAMIAVLAVGATAGSLITRMAIPDLPVATGPRVEHFVRQAQLAYAVYTPDPRRPVEVRRRSDLVTWLTRRMGRPIAVPDQLPHGLTLIGGRLLPGMPDRPAAQLMYQDGKGRRLTVYLRGMAEPTAPTAFRILQTPHVTTLYWVDRDWGYALSGDFSRDQMLDVSRALFRRYAESAPRLSPPVGQRE
jgi:anti-sigma factor RsiW